MYSVHNIVVTEYYVQCTIPFSTLEERAHRLFQTKGIPLSQLDPSLFAKSKASGVQDNKKQREIAFVEAQVYKYSELLGVSVCVCVCGGGGGGLLE